MRFLFLAIVFISPGGSYAQDEDLDEPSEEELLDFDKLDQNETGDETVVEEPPPEPIEEKKAPVAAKPSATPALKKAEAVPTPVVEEEPTPVQAEEDEMPPLDEEEPPPPVVTEKPTPEPVEKVEVPPPASDDTGSEKDRQKEARLARIYRNFYQTEISDSEWTGIAGAKTSESYPIQKGDTLWDISKVLFGSGFYWPKVWQLNDKITNPHLIEIGGSLKFSPGTVDEAPTLEVDPAVQVLANNTETRVDEEELPPLAQGAPSEKIMIPPPLRRTPLLGRLPPSIADQGFYTGNYDDAGFSKDILISSPEKDFITPVANIVIDADWESLGEVVEMEGDATVASTFQNIILEIKDGAKSGDFFTVYKNTGSVADPISGTTVGQEVETKAECAILELVEGQSDKYRAIIKNTALPVKIGDQIIAGRKITRTTLTLSNDISPIAARIVDGEGRKRRVFSLYTPIYLNRGSADGVQVGMILNVVKNIRIRNPDSVVDVDPKPIGKLKVAHVGEHVSTAVIVAQRDAIVPGDETSLQKANSVFQFNLETGGFQAVPVEPGSDENTSSPPEEEETSGNEELAPAPTPAEEDPAMESPSEPSSESPEESPTDNPESGTPEGDDLSDFESQ